MDPLAWSNPAFKQRRRPYMIQRDLDVLEKKQCVTNILRSGRFRDHLEGVLKGYVDGSAETKLQKLQANIVPISQIEAARASHRLARGVSAGSGIIIPINDLRGSLCDRYSVAEQQARCKLASLYRVIDRMGLTQMIYNHISLRVPGDKEHFLINPFGLHYSEVTAANLVKIDLSGNVIDPGTTQLGINRAGYIIHSAIHRGRKDIKCVVHLHSQYGAAVSAMKCGLLPISQEALLIGDISYHKYRGIACDEAEREEIIRDLGPVNRNMLLHNHGLLAMGESVEEAYSNSYVFIQACKIQVSALSVGMSDLIIVDKDIHKKVASAASQSGGGVSCHDNLARGVLEYEAIMRELDREGYNTGYPYKCTHLLVPGSHTGMGLRPERASEKRQGDDELQNTVGRIREEIKRIRRERQRQSSDNPVLSEEVDASVRSHNIKPHLPSSYQNGDVASGSHGSKSPVDTQKSSLWGFLDERNASPKPSRARAHVDTPYNGDAPSKRDTPSTRGKDLPSNKDMPSKRDTPYNGDAPSKRDTPFSRDVPSSKTSAPVWPADSARKSLNVVPHAHSPLVSHVYQPHPSLQSHSPLQPHPSLLPSQPGQSPVLVRNDGQVPETATSAKKPINPLRKDRLSKSTQSSSSAGSLHSGSSSSSVGVGTMDVGTVGVGTRGLDLSALDRARTIAEGVAHSTGQSVERLAYHKDQVEGHHHKRKRRQRRPQAKEGGPRDAPELHTSSGSSIASSEESSRQMDDGRLASLPGSQPPSGAQPPDGGGKQLLVGLDKVMHTAEQVAESTGASLQKLGQSRDLNN